MRLNSKDGELESFLLKCCWASRPSPAGSMCRGWTSWKLWLAFHPILEPNSIFFWNLSSCIPVSSFIYFPMGYLMHIWGLSGAAGWVALKGFQERPWCWCTAPLCKSNQHFLRPAPLLIHNISTSPLSFRSHFPPSDFSPIITPPTVSPGVTQPQLVLSAQHGRKQIFVLVGWDQTGHSMFLVARDNTGKNTDRTTFFHEMDSN